MDRSTIFIKDLNPKVDKGVGLSKPKLAGIHFILSQKDPDLADDFIRKMVAKLNLTEKHIVYSLIKVGFDATKEKSKDRSAIIKLIFYCWNQIRDDKPIQTFKIAKARHIIKKPIETLK